jgi:hypothetical protein
MTHRFLPVLILHLLGGLAAAAGTSPMFINQAPVQSPPDIAPQIDARAFVNESVFNVTGYALYGFYPLPYQTANTVCFTNYGSMSGDPGFLFDNFDGHARRWMDWWVNYGDLSCFNTNIITLVLGISRGNLLVASATNLVNSGYLNGDDQAVIQLSGQNIDLSRSRIRTAQPLDDTYYLYGGVYLLSTNYYNDPGVYDLYWGVGQDGVLGGQGTLMPLNGQPFTTPSFYPPFPSSPQHEVLDSYGFTNVVTVPYMNIYYPFLTNYYYYGYAAAAFTNQIDPSNLVVQVVFYPTNSYEQNLWTDVRFYPQTRTGGGALAVVGFHVVDVDTVLEVTYTNSIYLLDALAFRTNLVLARNYQTPTRKPHTYFISKRTPYQYYYGYPPNAAYDPAMLYQPTFTSNTVSYTYAGYAASISGLNYSPYGVPTLADPTNYPGRVEIRGDQVNLNQTRIRADATFILQAADLKNNMLARVNAPYVYFDVGSSQPQLLISNLAPSTVHRLSGEIYAWSGTWSNTETNALGTNNTKVHVLIVDHYFSSLQSVVLNRFGARVTNGCLRISDFLDVNRSLEINARDLWVQGGLSFPPAVGWANSNVANVVNFTNDGLVLVQGTANLGADRPSPYDNYVNHGTNVAAGFYIRAKNFENTAWIAANNSLLSLTADRASLLGQPVSVLSVEMTNYTYRIMYNTIVIVTNVSTNLFTNAFNATLAANGNVQIYANSLVLSNACLQAGGSLPGAITLSVTNQLTNAPGTTNTWVASGGVQMLTRPAYNSLMGTYILSRPGVYRSVSHLWPALDYGPVPEGFGSNNLALGKLTLDGATGSFFTFAGTTNHSALYVDYLELLNAATNHEEVVDIDPSLTIYFANANLSAAKLDGSHNGHIRWVKSFTGPLSSTNIVYVRTNVAPPTTNTYTFNMALVLSKDQDDDGDGIVNADDPTPIYVGETMALNIQTTKKQAADGSPQVLLSWQALRRSVSAVEHKPASDSPEAWQTLTTLTNSNALTQPLTAYDVYKSRNQRVYRVRVDPLPVQ